MVGSVFFGWALSLAEDALSALRLADPPMVARVATVRPKVDMARERTRAG